MIKKAKDHEITLAPEDVTVQRIGTPGSPAVYIAADYTVPVTFRDIRSLCISLLRAETGKLENRLSAVAF